MFLRPVAPTRVHVLPRDGHAASMIDASIDALSWRVDKLLALVRDEADTRVPTGETLSYTLQIRYFVDELVRLGRDVERIDVERPLHAPVRQPTSSLAQGSTNTRA
jgi:hypothetical protein